MRRLSDRYARLRSEIGDCHPIARQDRVKRRENRRMLHDEVRARRVASDEKLSGRSLELPRAASA